MRRAFSCEMATRSRRARSAGGLAVPRLNLALAHWLPWAGGLAGAALGALLGGGILLAISGAWYLLRGEEGMGLGDVKMLALVGAFLGWKGVIVTLFVSTLTGAAVGLALARKSSAGLKSKVPFGAFLALGALVALFAGAPLVDTYLGLLR